MTITRTNPIQHRHYDAVVIGARVAGAATAMLLARRGLRVLAVDRSGYGSDTLSSHALMRGAVTQLHRWGVLPDVIAAGTPALKWTVFQYGSTTIPIEIPDHRGVNALYAPRRTVLDRLLVDAARESGAEIHHGITLVEVLKDNGNRVHGVGLRTAHGEVDITADVVIGADGLRSSVARAVGAPITRQGHHASAYVLRYLTGVDLPTDRYHWLYSQQRGAGVIPTNDGQMAVFAGLPQSRFNVEARHDVTGTFHRVLAEIDPEVAAAVAGGTAAGPIRTFPGQAGQFRKPVGRGWMLVGDAGYFKDPYSAHGISDALRDAELLADALVDGKPERYERQRDKLSADLFDVLERVASYEWDLNELQQLHRQMSNAMNHELATLDELWPDQATLAAVA